MAIHRTNPDGVFTPPDEGHYAQVLETTDAKHVYIAGMISKNERGELVGVEDMNVQLRTVLDNVETALDAAGADFSDVVRRRTFTPDIEWFLEEQDDVYSDYWEHPDVPTSTLLEISALADSHQTGVAPGEPTDVDPRFLVEMDVTAVVEE